MVFGDDFRFGCDRQGDFDYLCPPEFGGGHGFDVLAESHPPSDD